MRAYPRQSPGREALSPSRGEIEEERC